MVKATSHCFYMKKCLICTIWGGGQFHSFSFLVCIYRPSFCITVVEKIPLTYFYI